LLGEGGLVKIQMAFFEESNPCDVDIDDLWAYENGKITPRIPLSHIGN
jgi:hypothetical protein